MVDELIERCSDALLLLADGTTVQCSRFVIMSECPVLRVIMELDPTIRDGKHVIPVADTGRAKYLNFCSMIHGASLNTLSFEEAVDVFDAARRFGAEKLQSGALRYAWTQVDVPRAIAAGIVPDLLREEGGSFAKRVVEAAAVRYPLWVDLEREFLTPLKHAADDPRVVKSLLTLQCYYPAVSVAKWLLINAKNPTEDVVVRIATAHPHFYCPHETRPVYSEANARFKSNDTWNQNIQHLFHSFLETTAWSGQIPTPANTCCSGTHVEFEDLQATFMSMIFPINRKHGKKMIQFGPYVRVRIPKGLALFGFDVHTRTLGTTDFQVRVTASRRMSLLDPFFEAWYSFSSTEGEWAEAGDPVICYGYDTINTELLDTSRVVYMRFDVRFSPHNAILNPFQ